jgi:hypothetical protein
VATVVFSETADAAMAALEANVGRARLLDRLDAAFAALAANPGDQRCRRRSYIAGVPGMWGMPVRLGDEDWLILWLAGPGDDEVTVTYVGPDL